MSTKKPRILIIGAGMSGLAAANKLHTSSNNAFDIHVAEGGDRIGGRIKTSVFCGDRVEMGATWIHGIEGNPVYEMAKKLGSLESNRPWEDMDGSNGGAVAVVENVYEVNNCLVNCVCKYFDVLMDFAQGKEIKEVGVSCCEMGKKGCENKEIGQNGMNCCELEKRGSGIKEIEQNGMNYCEMAKRDDGINEIGQFGMNYSEMAKRAYEICVENGIFEKISIGCFLRKGLELYKEEVKGFGDWDQESILEAVFEMKENMQRINTSADDLAMLDFEAEREYELFPGEEITIAKGYMSVIESLASVLPDGCVKLGEKVTKIEWSKDCGELEGEFRGEIRVVKVIFSDGSYMFADHVILTVSLGVLKATVCEKPEMFDPPLPSFKVDAISRLGYGVVNKLFMELQNGSENKKFPFLQMAFHKLESEFRDPKVPLWMKKTKSLRPIYGHSSVVLSWFAGKEALELESLEDEEIIEGVSNTLSCFTTKSELNVSSNFGKVLKTRWGNDPLFLGSYSYVAMGSSCDDLDTMAMPLPQNEKNGNISCYPFQILFAGEATHRTHYSTTHGAYFSGLREANRLLRHYGL